MISTKITKRIFVGIVDFLLLSLSVYLSISIRNLHFQDWKNYFLKDINETKNVLSLNKANGESAHLACRWLDGQFLIFAGSKNVHLAFRDKSLLVSL